jgi:hypothetical protein
LPDGILSAVAHAEHVRRGRRMTRLMSRIVPVAAGGLLLAAILVRFLHSPIAVFWTLFAVTAATLVVLAWIAGRAQAVTDAVAAQLDADAALGGELRSAHWFSNHPAADAWTAYHLAGAASRLQRVEWPAVYPKVKAVRAWAGSAALGLAALAIALSGAWPNRSTTVAAHESRAAAPAAGSVLPEDLQKQIDDLLRNVANGTMPMDAAREKIADLRNELAKIDPAMQEALAKAASTQAPSGVDTKPTDPKAADLAARAEKSADNDDLPGDMKWSLQDLAAKLNKASQQSSGATSPEATPSKDKSADAAPPQAQTGPQSTRVTTADSSSNLMMAAAAGPPGSDPGAQSDAARKASARQPLDLSGSLRKEAVEANEDSAGSNVLAEMRRKSEQSHSTIQFSHVAPLAAYDKSHASAPPAPPDALRALVQQYFIRR